MLKVLNSVSTCLSKFFLFEVARNAWMKEGRIGRWGPTETSGGFPFKVGQPFILEFRAGAKDIINIYVDEKYFTYFVRYSLSKISQIEITQDIKVSSITLCK
ncbi:unnamed protein product [Meloidogyne enterolobii]|uniref:Uncharacterized protein n=1 Tax=Meloidogyne enterolobii TaxID=390850 RepID=A0ACB0YHW9_MELEN